jgi:hypothetical protein
MSLPDPIPGKRSRRVEIALYVSTMFLTGLVACGCGDQTSQPGPPAQPPPPPVAAATSYVDCSAATNGSGTQSSPWNNLTAVDAVTFNPGDQILFKRGTTCNGILDPLGSGTAASPIVIDAYGTGAQPIIDGGTTNNAVVALSNQQGWEINNLEIVGGNQYGVYISGSALNTAYTHFRLTNLNIHGAHYVSSGNDSGEVFISIGNAGETFNDIVIDGLAAHDSQVFYGIFIDAGVFPTSSSDAELGNNIAVQNSTVYNLSGIGITLFVVSNGLMQNNVVHNTGQCPLNPGCGSNTPGGLMDLYCHTCIIQNNESYSIQDWSPWDGGDFDIDVWNDNNIVQYNYGHDAAGYCVSVFSADDYVGTNNIVRYNVCSNNAQMADIADPGEIFMNGNGAPISGTLNGVEVYNNTFYWNPATPGPAFNTVNGNFSGTNPNFFRNNIIYSTVPNLIETTSDFSLDNNIYWTAGTAPDWNINGTDYTDLVSYQAASGQDKNSMFADPMLNTPTYHTVGRPVMAFTLMSSSPALGASANVCSGISGCSMGTQDFWGNALPNGSGYNIGAWQ